jgi:anaerobic magnesium-protoporphyrin IX monomethyl ester cyclase
MKVMISYPPLEGKGSPMLTQNRQFQWYNVPSYIYPLVSAMAATLLNKEGFEVIWNDCIAQKWSYEQFLNLLKEEKPELVAFETKTPVIKQHWKIINDIKGQSPSGTIPKTVLFGDHVTALPEESLLNSLVDFVITGGDYDISLLSIAKHLRDKTGLAKGIWYRENGGISNTGKFELNADLDSLPFINRDLTKAKLYGEKWKRRTPFFYTQAGRDCWWKQCSFCAWTVMYPTFRSRSPQNLLDEIGYLIKHYNAREIFDDTGTFPCGKWLQDFCEGMIKYGYNKKILFSCNMNFSGINDELIKLMKRANFRKLKMGMESANQSTLDRLSKGISIDRVADLCKMVTKSGLDIHLTVMVGFPWETKNEALNTLKFADMLMKKGWIEMLQATILVPYPGTRLYEEGMKNNWFRFNPDAYERFDMSEPVFKTPDMTPEEVMQLCRRTYETFLSPGFILRNLLKIRSFNDVAYNLKGLKAVMGHIKDFRRYA